MAKNIGTTPTWIKNMSPMTSMIAFGVVAGTIAGAADLAYTATQKAQCPEGTTPVVKQSDSRLGLPIFNKTVECTPTSR